ncbi:SDR family NAD(P)-dependent oxidoreductase [Pseudomonas sp. REB1044]|uniref:SDR family NAD(P)-dependent oxidoreductase n=1 Tax=Pseudomonas sp. REB1044 TaxID=2675224 RepID=UPI00315DE182
MNEHAIAVIGISCRLPAACDPHALWRNLLEAKVCSTRYDTAQLREMGVSEALINDPRFVPVDGRMAGADLFDAALYGISIREAQLLDPQHRLLLDCAWELIQTSGLGNQLGRPCIGLFAGASMNTYLTNVIGGHADLSTAQGTERMLANDKDYMCARVAYKLGFEGPCMSVQTGCSSSLSAVHLAINSLLLGECEIALAGGVSYHAQTQPGYLYQPDLMFSKDGSCRPFDAQSSGTFFADGAALVALRPLQDALVAGDEILAVISASAVNNDGAARAGFTAPGVDGQSRLIRQAQVLAQVAADEIGMIEAHGTGTRLGDPIEFDALCRAFAETTDRRGFCALGSVKANLGHLAAAAGVAGLLRAVLALRHDCIPPHPTFSRANPACALESSPFVINTQARPWANGCTRRAGVSAFGAGGSNVHVILEQAPARVAQIAVSPRQPQAIVLSGRDEHDVHWLADALHKRLQEPALPELEQIAKTLSEGRTALDWRASLYVQNIADLADQLGSKAYRVLPKQPDQGVIIVHLDEALYQALEQEPAYRAYRDAMSAGASAPGASIEGAALEANASRQWLHRLLPRQALEFVSTPLPQSASAGETAFWTQPSGNGSSVLDLHAQTLRAWLATLWERGAEVDWSCLRTARTLGHCHLPLAPLRPVRCWYEPQQESSTDATPSSGERAHIYVEHWQRLGLLHGVSTTPNSTPYALHAQPPLREALIDQLHRLGHKGAGADEHAADTVVWLLDEWPTSSDGPDFAWWLCSQVKACVHRKRPKMELILLGSGFVDPWGAGNVDPGPSAALACIAALGHEHPSISIKVIDLMVPTDSLEVACQVLTPVLQRLDALPALCAVRAGSVWIRQHDPLPVSVSTSGPRPASLCLVTGGLGTVGFGMAHYVARRQGCDLIVLQRASDDPQRATLREQRLQTLRATGVRVTVVEADVCDREQLHGVLEQLRRDGLQIDAFIHAAGASGDATQQWLMRSEPEQWQRLMAPKWLGARWLDEWFAQTPLRFGCFVSSLAVLAGGLGLGPYAAANEACAWWSGRSRSNAPYFSIDWEGWQGWVHSGDLRYGAQRGEGLGAAEVDAALDSIFSSVQRFSRFIVSDRLLAQRLAAPVSHQDVETSSTCSLEAMLQLWREVLHCPVQDTDNFFDLGGDSLVGAELVRRANARFGVGLAMVDLFEYSSAQAFARQVAAIQEQGVKQ